MSEKVRTVNGVPDERSWCAVDYFGSEVVLRQFVAGEGSGDYTLAMGTEEKARRAWRRFSDGFYRGSIDTARVRRESDE